MLVFAMVAHEYAHAVTALHEGDDTAYTLGRVTLNPLPHIDPWMSLLLPALLWFGSGGSFTFGGAKPVPVNSRKFRNFRRGDILVSAAGRHDQPAALAWSVRVLFVLLGLVARGVPGAMRGAGHRAADDGVRDLAQPGALLLQPHSDSPARRLAPPVSRAAAARRARGTAACGRFGYLPLFALLFSVPAGGRHSCSRRRIARAETSCCDSSCRSRSVTDGTSSS